MLWETLSFYEEILYSWRCFLLYSLAISPISWHGTWALPARWHWSQVGYQEARLWWPLPWSPGKLRLCLAPLRLHGQRDGSFVTADCWVLKVICYLPQAVVFGSYRCAICILKEATWWFHWGPVLLTVCCLRSFVWFLMSAWWLLEYRKSSCNYRSY